MTQTPQKDKPSEEKESDPTTRELVEALAAAYFSACRKIARIVNRGGKRS